MVALLVTIDLLPHLQALNLTSHIQTTGAISTISHKPLCKALRSSSTSSSLHTLLSLTSLHPSHISAVDSLAPPQRDPIVAARVAKLQANVEEAQYRAIVRDVARATTEGTNAEMEMVRLSRLAPQLSLGANVIISMATCFVAGYFVVRASTGSESWALVGGIAGLIVAMGVEVVLLMTRLYAIERAAEKEKGRREKKRGG